MIYGNAIMLNYPLVENMRLKCSYRTVWFFFILFLKIKYFYND
jgi:hypothetical protein